MGVSKKKKNSVSERPRDLAIFGNIAKKRENISLFLILRGKNFHFLHNAFKYLQGDKLSP